METAAKLPKVGINIQQSTGSRNEFQYFVNTLNENGEWVETFHVYRSSGPKLERFDRLVRKLNREYNTQLEITRPASHRNFPRNLIGFGF